MFREIILPIFRSTRLCVTACGVMHPPRCCRPSAEIYTYALMGKTCWNLLCNNFFLIFVFALSCPFPLQLRVSVSARKQGIQFYRYPTDGTISHTQLSHEYVNSYEFRGRQRDREQYTHTMHHKLHLNPSTNPLIQQYTHIMHHKLHLNPSTNTPIQQYTHNLNSSRSISSAKWRNFQS